VRTRLHACLVFVLALASAACSGSTRSERDAASPSTTLSTIPGTLHDTVPSSTDAPTTSSAAASSSNVATRSGTDDGAGTKRGAGSATTTTTGSGSKSSTPTSTPTPPPSGLPAEKCPEPKTCRRYVFHGDGAPHRWRTGSDGRVTIRYRINPSAATSLSPEQIEGAIRAAFETWERAAPTLNFVYDGRTTMQAVPDDGVNVIAFNGPTFENTTPMLDREGYVTEFDMLYTANGWAWMSCQQADNSCTPISGTTTGPASRTPTELQSIATHAVGHALWLGDMDINDSLNRNLTMFPDHTQHPPGSRFWSTLALGDVLGVRALYPCSCPLPPIYDP